MPSLRDFSSVLNLCTWDLRPRLSRVVASRLRNRTARSHLGLASQAVTCRRFATAVASLGGLLVFARSEVAEQEFGAANGGGI